MLLIISFFFFFLISSILFIIYLNFYYLLLLYYFILLCNFFYFSNNIQCQWGWDTRCDPDKQAKCSKNLHFLPEYRINMCTILYYNNIYSFQSISSMVGGCPCCLNKFLVERVNKITKKCYLKIINILKFNIKIPFVPSAKFLLATRSKTPFWN